MQALASWIWWLLAAAVYPLWLASGVLDYACHRRDRIEASTGAMEPLLHLAQALQIGVAVLLVLWFALTPAVLLLASAAVLLHTVTAYVDIAWASARRPISALEQFAHTLLVGLPLVAFALLLVIGWTGAEVVDGEAFQLRRPPFPSAAVLAVIGSGTAIAVLPAILEWRRSRRAAG